MPTATEETIAALAFCPDARCYGYQQQEVQAVKTTTVLTYIDNGGDLPGEERSFSHLRFANEADVPCPECKRDRMISDQVRPVYAPISGQDQNALLHMGETPGRVRDLEHAQELAAANAATEMAELKALVKEQQAQIQQLLEKPKRQAKDAA